MRILNRENQLPLHNRGYDLICPSCSAEYTNEGWSGRKAKCPNCGFTWVTQINGNPRTEAIGKGINGAIEYRGGK